MEVHAEPLLTNVGSLRCGRRELGLKDTAAMNLQLCEVDNVAKAIVSNFFMMAGWLVRLYETLQAICFRIGWMALADPSRDPSTTTHNEGLQFSKMMNRCLGFS